jgi:hypothetical protein
MDEPLGIAQEQQRLSAHLQKQKSGLPNLVVDSLTPADPQALLSFLVVGEV